MKVKQLDFTQKDEKSWEAETPVGRYFIDFDTEYEVYSDIGEFGFSSDFEGAVEIANEVYRNNILQCIQEDTAYSTQIGGNHYKDMKIQPVEFCMKNNLNYCQSSAIKYICRYKNKNGEQDLDKAIHFIQLLKQIEYEVKSRN